MTDLTIDNILIEDELSGQDNGAIEVTITLSNGERRWCYFMNLAALKSCGDWIDGTETYFHYDAPYMVVIPETLSEDLIIKALRTIEKNNDILKSTKIIE